MIIKKIECEDFLGNQYTEEACFNLTASEIAEIQLSVKGGLQPVLEEIVKTEDTPRLLEFFKKLIFKSYGRISEDGRRLEKSDKISEEFSQTNAYDKLFMELTSDPDKASQFFMSVFPKDMVDKINGSPIPPQ